MGWVRYGQGSACSAGDAGAVIDPNYSAIDGYPWLGGVAPCKLCEVRRIRGRRGSGSVPTVVSSGGTLGAISIVVLVRPAHGSVIPASARGHPVRSKALHIKRKM